MNREDFERMVTEEGYSPVHRELKPDLALDAHDHAWDTKGLVLRGEFTIVCGSESRIYGPGDIFELAAGVTHTENAGTEGAELVVGRRAGLA